VKKSKLIKRLKPNVKVHANKAVNKSDFIEDTKVEFKIVGEPKLSDGDEIMEVLYVTEQEEYGFIAEPSLFRRLSKYT